MPQPPITASSADFPLLGAAHLVILGVVPLLAAILALVQRRLGPECRWPRLGLGTAILLDTLLWYAVLARHRQLSFPSHLPLEFCDITLWLMVMVLFTRSPALFDLAYYGGLAGSSMALLTPNLWERFPSLSTVQFFIAHGLVVAAALFLVWSGQARPRPGSLLRALLFTNAWAVLDGVFDAIFKSNYMFLRAKPARVSLLNFLGPWPWYIAAGEGVALVLFLLLYLPFRRPANDASAEKE